jgi:hypothetical protein
MAVVIEKGILELRKGKELNKYSITTEIAKLNLNKNNRNRQNIKNIFSSLSCLLQLRFAI